MSGRFVAFALALALTGAAALPALAEAPGPAMLQTFIGSWKGQGAFNGGDSGKTNCRLVFKAKGANVVYSGRCSAGLGSQTFSGTLAYNTKTRQFEAHSRDAAVAGKVVADAIVFDLATDSDRGHARSIMSFAPTGITIDLTLTDEKSEVTTAHIAFLKS